ncbi:TerC family protein [Hazenella sp. IB182357]|uniref:TerC family protein n=1 Tax=Polycladospora coralii TaxID=2771432 RepID=A0A926N9C4_9BACL|nr:TerC family protein [Polycladospora coralii]MBD1370865.1 TerC family protein [Polycladospora coralii]MBS7529804.1 TerC family protein [Polycladospora coralii]
MDYAVLIEYGWILLVLIILEGILAADNALVIAIMVKHLPEKERKKALFYGLAGAFVFRFLSLFAISFLIHVWQLQAIGAFYLFAIALNHIIRKWYFKKSTSTTNTKANQSGFWMTVLKVEITDIIFAVDSILAAVALAVSLPRTSLPPIGGIDGGQFLVVLAGGLIGLIVMRFAATFFSGLLEKRPGLETVAFLIVGWVGVKLAVFAFSHPKVAIFSESFPSSFGWKITFWSVLLGIAIIGWFSSKDKRAA